MGLGLHRGLRKLSICPTVVERVQKGKEFLGGFTAASLGWVVVAGRVSQSVAAAISVFDGSAVIAVVGVAGSEDVIEVKDGYIWESVVVLIQPIVDQPLVESAGIFSVCRVT